MRECRPRSRLDGPERNPQFLRDLALGEVAPVGEGDHLALALRQGLERAVDAPLDPRPLGTLVRAGLERGLLGRLRRRLVARSAAVDDCVPRPPVEPRSAGPPLRLLSPRPPPDPNQRL